METTDVPSTITVFGFVPEAVVIGGGDLPVHPLPCKWLQHNRLVCCDGAANQWLHSDRKPWRIVGDGDSLSEEALRVFADIIRINPDQETNDQTKAVYYLRTKGYKKIALLGATGRREDHTLGNISLLIDYMHQGLETRIYTDHGVFIPCSGTHSFCCPAGTAVSIFSFGTQGMTSTGLAYPIYDFQRWWQGTLNHTVSETFTITCQGDYLIYINYENKKIRE